MRALIWIDVEPRQGWACSACNWSFPVPTLLSDPQARAAYDRLAAARFREHQCATAVVDRTRGTTETSVASVAERARALVKKGYKPKDAVQLVLEEMQLEFSAQPRVMEQARKEAEIFLDKIRRGMI